MFKFEEFLKQYNIDYIDSGTNVKKGNININCPFCNLPESHHSSHHLGIDPSTNYWGCWRDTTHRGKKPHKLIIKLIGCSFKEAARLVGDSQYYLEEDTFSKLVHGTMFSNQKEQRKIIALQMRGSFRKFDERFNIENNYLDYLESERGFHHDAVEVVMEYDLRYCVRGDYKDRIIIPVRLKDRLVCWTARSINRSSKLRYKTLSAEESETSIKDLVYNYDNAIQGGKVLFITEGPFDSLKVDFYGKGLGCRSIALFNMNCEPNQEYWLRLLSKKYNKFVILLDSGEIKSANELYSKLEFHDNVHIGKVPVNTKDPGDMRKRQVEAMCNSFL